jgi:arsenate reductase
MIDLLVKYPKLIERPIIVKGNKAIIGRPPTLVVDF